MRKFTFLLLATVYTLNATCQSVVFLPVSYSVDAMYDEKNGIRFHCDQEERLQDELLFYTFAASSADTVVLFRSPIYNGYLKGTPRWYNEKGQLIKEIRTYDGGCTVHASSHYFSMPGYIRMYLPALIDYCYTWQTDEPGLKKMQEFYDDGYLEKKIRYYSNGQPQSEEHYVISRSLNWNTYEDFNVEVGGLCIYYYDNGKKQSEGTKTTYQKTGTWRYYSNTGVLSSEEIYHNKDSITTITYYPGGQKESVYTQHFYRTSGDKSTFHESGELKSYTHYTAGNQDTTLISYHKNGKIESITPCCGYWQNGTFTSWHDNGLKHEEVQVVDGDRTGRYTAWHPNGKIKTKGRYGEYDWRVGKWYFYNEDGSLASTRNYDLEPEEPEAVQDVVADYWQEERDPLYDLGSRDFKISLPVADFTRPTYGQTIEVSKANNLAVVQKYGNVDVRIDVDSLGNTTYQILTPMKEKHLLALQSYLAQHLVFEEPFMLLGKPVATTIMMLLTYQAAE